jgi:hypothetical protein
VIPLVCANCLHPYQLVESSRTTSGLHNELSEIDCKSWEPVCGCDACDPDDKNVEVGALTPYHLLGVA